MNIKQTIFQHYPALPVAVSIIIGIMAGGQIHCEMAWLALTLAATAVAALTGRHSACQSTAILLGFMSLGAFLAIRQEKNVAIMLPEKAITYDAVVTSEAKEHAKTWSADIMITSGIMKGKTVKAFFLKQNARPPLPTLRLRATSTMTMPQHKPGETFDYGKYLLRHGTSATTFIPPWECNRKGYGTEGLTVTAAVTAKLRLIRLMLIKKTGEWGMDADTEPLIAGVALGLKSSISPTLRDTYSQAGAAHVLALSGLHLGIIWALLGVFCIGRWRTPFTMLMIATVWAYVLFAALPPSAVRAAIMLTVMSAATLTGRHGASLNTLAFAAMVILLFSPSSIYDLGFQLSFTAVAFIVVLTNPVMNLLPQQWRITHPPIYNQACKYDDSFIRSKPRYSAVGSLTFLAHTYIYNSHQPRGNTSHHHTPLDICHIHAYHGNWCSCDTADSSNNCTQHHRQSTQLVDDRHSIAALFFNFHPYFRHSSWHSLYSNNFTAVGSYDNRRKQTHMIE